MLKPHELFSRTGPARQHFSKLENGAPWVDDVCDAIVSDSFYAQMQAISANERVKFFTFYRIADDHWQVKFSLDSQNNMFEATRPTLYEAFNRAMELIGS